MPLRRTGAVRRTAAAAEAVGATASPVAGAYELLHRYLWIRDAAAERRVLDLGGAEGVGHAVLADAAGSLLVGPGDLSTSADGSLDLVVAFKTVGFAEGFEHLVRSAARVLTADGLLVVDVSDPGVHDGTTPPDRPASAECVEILERHFANVDVFGQRPSSGSVIEAMEASEGPASFFAVGCDETGAWQEVGGPGEPVSLIAVAGPAGLRGPGARSVLSDDGLGLLREVTAATDARVAALELAAAAEQRRADAARRHVLAAEEDVLRALEQVEAERRARIAGERRQAEAMAEAADQARVEAVVGWARELDLAGQEVRAVHEQRERERAEYEAATQWQRQELQRISESVTWRAFMKARGKLYSALGGRDSRPARVLSAGLRGVGRLATARKERRAPAPVPVVVEVPAEETPVRTIVFPVFDDPVVSIVIPVYDDAELTERCLRAILHATDDVPYEVIVVDDGTDADVQRLLDGLEGAVVLRNDENLGYLRTVNRGAAHASGEHLLHLNNDTEPQPGWLGPLVSRLEGAADVGVVVPKLLFPDGRLQEAGSIVWSDGNAWNYGHGEPETACAYNFVREVDYGSAAAMLVRGELWRALGGFDERFAPGYYEDVDLCFSARQHGFRVLYEPTSRVVHVQGGSMGTDLEVGGKRHQVLNRAAFADKWASELADHEHGPGPDRGRVAIAADRGAGDRVLVVDHAVPQPDQDAGSLRMFHLVENLVRLGHRVTFLPDNFAAPAPHTARLQALGVEVLYGELHLTARLAGIAPETRLAILSRPYVASRYLHLVREFLPGAMVAYDTVDLHYLRERRRAELEGNPNLAKSDSFRELELGLARGCDVTLTVSEQEAEQLRSDAEGVDVAVVPLANRVWERPPSREERHGLLFIGNFVHPPNVDAVEFLVGRVMPIVWARVPDVRLVVAGGNVPPVIRSLASTQVEITGWVEDLDPLVGQSVAMVAPLRYGAGVKGKVAQALASGLPVVTTPIGAEGLGAEVGSDLLVGATAQELAEAVIEVLHDRELWARLSGNGQALLSRTASPAAQREALRALLARGGQSPA